MTSHGIDAASGTIPAVDGPRTGVLGILQRMLDGVNTAAAVAAALAIAAAGLILTWEVAGRYFFRISSDWQDESSVLLLVGATFVSAAFIQARRGHVAIDALGTLLPAPVDQLRRWLADLLSFLFVAYFTWKSGALLHEAWVDGQTTPSSWGPPLWIPYASMTFGMGLLALQLLLQVLSGRHRDAQPAHLAPSPPLAEGAGR